jgi:hypothetical protein
MDTKVNRRGAGTVAQEAIVPGPSLETSSVVKAACLHSDGLAVAVDEIATKATNSEAMKMRQRVMSLSS